MTNKFEAMRKLRAATKGKTKGSMIEGGRIEYGVGGRVLNERNVDTVALQSDINQKVSDIRAYERNKSLFDNLTKHVNRDTGLPKTKRELKSDYKMWEQMIGDKAQAKRMWEDKNYLKQIQEVAVPYSARIKR